MLNFFLPPANLFWLLADVLQILVLLILVDVIRSWLQYMGTRGVSSYTPWVRTLQKIVDPILAPFRALWFGLVDVLGRTFRMRTYALRRFDLSPMLAIIAIQVLQNILFHLGYPTNSGF